MAKNSKEVQRRADEKRAGQRTRNWTFIIYPESVTENWKELLEEEHIEWIESPLHDKDQNATGEAKKPHKHVLVLYEGPKTFEQVSELTERLGATVAQRCASAKALVRYMAHLDNPEKAQYSTSEIIGHGGADVAEMLRPSSSERYALIGEMITYIKKNNITEFTDIMQYAMEKRFDDWFPLLCDSCAYVIGLVIKSQWHKGGTSVKVIRVDSQTGETLD